MRRDFSRAVPAPHHQLSQALEHLAGSIAAPYGTYQGTVLPTSKKGSFAQELRNQFLDIKAPTPGQIAGQKAALQRAKQEAAGAV